MTRTGRPRESSGALARARPYCLTDVAGLATGRIREGRVECDLQRYWRMMSPRTRSCWARTRSAVLDPYRLITIE